MRGAFTKWVGDLEGGAPQKKFYVFMVFIKQKPQNLYWSLFIIHVCKRYVVFCFFGFPSVYVGGAPQRKICILWDIVTTKTKYIVKSLYILSILTAIIKLFSFFVSFSIGGSGGSPPRKFTRLEDLLKTKNRYLL